MVNNDARSIKDNHIGLRGKKAAQKLTLKHGLIVAERKNLALTHQEALDQSEANRYKIYTAIMESLPKCRNLEELEARLKTYGIEVLYKFKGQTQERQGISFRLEKDVFKGSKVDRNFSLGNLEKTLSQGQRQNPIQVIEATNPIRLSGRGVPNASNPASQLAQELENILLQSTGNLLSDLMKPEYVPQGVNPDLLREARKKKKRKKLR